MEPSSTSPSPIILSSSLTSVVYALFALAMGLTVLGVWLCILFLPSVSGSIFFAAIVLECVLLFSAPIWSRIPSLNLVLFLLFPILSGFSITPYFSMLVHTYVNGLSIILNAAIATTAMSLAAAVLARGMGFSLRSLGGALFAGLIGLIVLGLVQIFVPALQSGTFELLLSGAGMVIFCGFLAYDLQRVARMAQVGVNPFLLALHLYLDVFNLFLYAVRFITALSGQRR